MDIEHISLAQKADVFVVVPATANVIGKIANGIADDMVTTTIMATKAKVLIAPAMNTNMYSNPIYKENESKLRKLGYLFVNPTSGKLACEDVGEGKLANTEDIVKRIEFEILSEKKLKGYKILVTAGPTVEKIDPVRFITNRSTGKMGYAIAKKAKLLGGEVSLITGPTNIERPSLDEIVEIESANEMYNEVMKYKDADIIIMTAAVSDYKPKNFENEKIKKNDSDFILELDRNKDILYELGKIKNNQILVGFAAETTNIEEYAIKKLEKKNLDLIIANDVSKKNIGFGTDLNKVIFFDKYGNREEFEEMSKDLVAGKILNKIIGLLKSR